MFYILLMALLLGSAFADRVPVMMWTNMESGEFPAVLAGHSVSTVDFERNYVDRYSELNRNLIVFVQNKLSIADISHYANIYGYEDEKDSTFQNVKNLMSEQTSTHLPNVVSPVSVFEGNKRKMKVLSEPYNIDELMSDSASNLGLILVKLSDVDVSDHQKSLQQNDKIIGDVVKQLDHHNIKYTVIYTAVSSGKKRAAQDFLLDGSRGRQLLADSTSSGSVSNTSAFFNVDDSIYLYLGGLSVGNTISLDDAVPLDLTYLKVNEESSMCSNETVGNASSCVISLQYTWDEQLKNLSLTNLSFTFSFSKSSGNDWGYWYISSLDLSYTNRSDSGDVAVEVGLNPGSLGAWSPFSYSFSCYSPSVIVPRNKTQKADGPFMFFKKFQVQAYGGFSNGGFGYYNDCEPFFTIGIWMALISLAVMIGILVFGLYMLCQITTMDRFDDPKGKTIIVAAAAD